MANSEAYSCYVVYGAVLTACRPLLHPSFTITDGSFSPSLSELPASTRSGRLQSTDPYLSTALSAYISVQIHPQKSQLVTYFVQRMSQSDTISHKSSNISDSLSANVPSVEFGKGSTITRRELRLRCRRKCRRHHRLCKVV